MSRRRSTWYTLPLKERASAWLYAHAGWVGLSTVATFILVGVLGNILSAAH